MPFVDAGGLRLYCEQHGQGEPLLCIQGTSLDVSGWRAQLRTFSRHYRTIVFDNRDTGRSSYASSLYTVRELAQDARAVADALALERFHVLGSSLGGAIAQELALAVPERLASLTLAVSYGGYSAWDRERTRLFLQSIQTKSDEELTAEMMLWTLSESAYEEVHGEVLAMARLVMANPYRQRREGFVRQLQASMTHETRSRLGALAMPVHVIGAENDIFVPVWKARELARLIPGARLSIVAGAGHAVNLERAQEYNTLVLDFLRSVQGAGAVGVR